MDLLISMVIGVIIAAVGVGIEMGNAWDSMGFNEGLVLFLVGYILFLASSLSERVTQLDFLSIFVLVVILIVWGVREEE